MAKVLLQLLLTTTRTTGMESDYEKLSKRGFLVKENLMVNELEMVEKEVKKFDIAGCRFLVLLSHQFQTQVFGDVAPVDFFDAVLKPNRKQEMKDSTDHNDDENSDIPAQTSWVHFPRFLKVRHK